MPQAKLGQLRIEGRTEGPDRTLLLAGELDLVTCPALYAEIQRLCAEGVGEIVLDLRDLSFIDSTGLRTILTIKALCEEHGCGLFLTSGQRQVQRLFAVSGLLDQLPFRSDESSAEGQQVELRPPA
jgi:anti-sigma B factor antagonist